MRGIRTIATIALAISVSAAACGGSGSKPHISSFTATPAALPKGGGPVTFQWSATHARSFTIEPFVGAVTGTSATFVVTTGANFTLSARNANGFDRSQTTITVGAPFTVSGAVVDDQRGALPGLSVFVLGQEDVIPALTTSDGSFALDGVVAPYDLVVASTVAPFAFEYRGLTRADPFVFLPAVPLQLPVTLPSQKLASASGALAGATFPLSGSEAIFGQSSSPRTHANSVGFDPATGDWGTVDTLLAESSVQETAAFLLAAQTGGDPDYRFASRVETVAVGLSTGETLTLAAIPTLHATGTVTAPFASTIGVPAPLFRLSPAPSFQQPPDTMLVNSFVVSTSTTFSWGIPALPVGASYALDGTSSAAGSTLEAFRLGSGERDLVVQPPPAPELPLPNAQIGVNDRFVRELPPGVVAGDMLSFGGGLLFVLSTDPQFTLHDVGADELGLLPQTAAGAVTWQAFGFGIFGSMDEALDPAGATGDLYYATSPSRGVLYVP